MEVLATYAKTLRGTLSPNETPWPGSICLLKLAHQMPDERQEIRIKRPASHTMLSAFYFYTIVIRWTQGDVY